MKKFKMNPMSASNTIRKKKKNNIIELNSLCKTLDEDKEIYHGDNVLDSSSSTDKSSHEEQASNQSFCKDQKNSNKHKSKPNKANNRYKIDLDKELECKSINDYKEGQNNKKKNQVSNKDVSEKPNYSESDQKQSIFPDRDNTNLQDIHNTINDDGEGWNSKKKIQSRFSDRQFSHVSDKFDQKKAVDRNNTDLNDTCKTINDDGEEWNSKKKIQSRFSDRQFSHVSDKFDQKKAVDRNNTDLNDTCKTINDDGEEWNSKKKIQSRFSDRQFSHVSDKFDQKKAVDSDNINLNDTHQIMNNDKEGWNSKKKIQSRFSDRQFSHVSDKFDQKKAVDRNNTDLYGDTFKSRSYGKGRNSYDTNNQKQRKNEISISENFKQNETQNRSNSDLHGKSLINLENCIFEEIDEDLFKLSKDYSLAHCVAEDLRMGAGIAVDFKRIFGGVGKLVDQKLKIGNVGIVERHNQYAFYLVTKKFSNGKPTINTMEKVLRSLVIIMKKFNLTKLGIPKIGCGLDKLDWSDTKSLIIDIFSGSGIDITVCVPSKLIDSKTPQRLNVYISPCNLWEMMAKTIIVLFIDLEQVCKKNWKDNVVDNVDTKYPFKQNLLKDVKNNKFDPGAITKYTVNNEEIICIFITQNALYSSLEDGFRSIDKAFKYYKFLAIQSGPIEPSDNFKHISWIVLIVRSISHSCELWLCGDVSQTNVIYYDKYCKNLNRSSMSYSFQSSSPIQNNNKYISNRHSLNMKETSNQNQIRESSQEYANENSFTKTDT
ncbi:uncharacterized protein LOC132919335 isoform X2 [Rhopalosiphum padi]|uniref:uncharacterized protein LOC132919335 isoform X2 n=1 Tax=Rhopalosiphum padi TaxID=40932 RepID=UPI00298D9E5A|nr:uncharacterized protein LOC132919335 isoform X2 [Rhopalosiphum padi]